MKRVGIGLLSGELLIDGVKILTPHVHHEPANHMQRFTCEFPEH